MFGASFYSFSLHAYDFSSGYDSNALAFFFFLAISIRIHLKKRYHNRLERVREYLETIKEFDKFISPESLFLHFLGPEPSNHIRKNVEIVKKSKFFFFFVTIFFSIIGFECLFSFSCIP